jgi:hypothetical protein
MRAAGLGVLVVIVLSLAAPPAGAQASDIRFEMLAADEKAIVDRLAARFYEDGLRKAQAYAIEARTSARYVGATPAERARFRDERRTRWAQMTEAERQALRSVVRPSFSNLTEEQKAPFRTIALDRLEAQGAIDHEALADALRKDI